MTPGVTFEGGDVGSTIWTILATLLLLAPAQPPAAQPAAARAAPAHATAVIATHATSGIVKSIDQTNLVLERKSGVHGELRFVLNTGTERAGEVSAGATVEVRYRMDGKQRVATAVSAEPPRR